MKQSFDEIRYLSFVKVVDEDGFVDTTNLIEKPLYYFVNNETREGLGTWSKNNYSEGSINDLISEYIEKSFIDEYRKKVDSAVSFDYLRELLVGTDEREFGDFEEENEKTTFVCESWARQGLEENIGYFAVWSILNPGVEVVVEDGKITINGELINELDDIFPIIEDSADNAFVVIK